jgi:hypothetical protein
MRMRRLALAVVPLVPVCMFFGTRTAGAQVPTAVNACYGSSGFDASGTWNFSGAADESPGAACFSTGAGAVADLENGPFGLLGLADGTVYSGVALTGTGTYACGNGQLSGTGSMKTVSGSYTLTWSADFSNNVGTVTGTADNGSGVLQALSGTIVANDHFVGLDGLDCDDSYHPMSQMPTIDDTWTPPGSIPTAVPAGLTVALLSIS